MNKQIMTVATVTKNGVVQRFGMSSIPCPEIKFKGGSIKWYEDKMKPNQEVHTK